METPGSEPTDRRDDGAAHGEPQSASGKLQGKPQETVKKAQGQQYGAAYQGTLEACFAILIASVLGYWADEHYATSPRYLIIGVAIGFAAFVLRLFRLRPLLEASNEDDNQDLHGPTG